MSAFLAHTFGDMSVILNVLIACEESQAECKAFRALGHLAFSCDIQECNRKGNPDWHIKGDVTPYLHGRCDFVTQSGVQLSVPRWDLIIAHPPCTYLTKVGSPWLYKNPDLGVFFGSRYILVNAERYAQMSKARDFFYSCLNACAHYVAVENPIPMALAQLPKSSTYVDPSWFGVRYTKKTLYWLKNLPPVMAQIIHPRPKCFVTASRGKYRSRTFPQLAEAIATQWSAYIIEDMRQRRALLE